MCELGRRQAAERAVQANVIAFIPPIGQHDLEPEQGVELPTVEHLVTESAVERLDPGVLPRRARIAEYGFRTAEPAPVGHCMDQSSGPAHSDPSRPPRQPGAKMTG
jgi:hypothetical protein